MVHRVLVVVFAAQVVLAQESDFIDTGELVGRGIAFEGTPGAFFSVQGLSSVGDVNGDGFSDIGFSRAATRSTDRLLSPAAPGCNRPAAPRSSTKVRRSQR